MKNLRTPAWVLVYGMLLSSAMVIGRHWIRPVWFGSTLAVGALLVTAIIGWDFLHDVDDLRQRRKHRELP
jgi:cytosine/uracil/thiamine/allantoin permease